MSIKKSLVLFPVEKALKIGAIPAGAASLGASGSALERIGEGVYGAAQVTAQAIPATYNAVMEVIETGRLNMTVGMNEVQTAIDYANQITTNLKDQPGESIAVATGLAAGMYLAGSTARFFRKEGLGNMVQEKAREWADKKWRNSRID